MKLTPSAVCKCWRTPQDILKQRLCIVSEQFRQKFRVRVNIEFHLTLLYDLVQGRHSAIRRMLSVPVYSKYLKTSFFYPAFDGHSVFECMVLDDANGTCHLGTRLLVGGWCE